MANYKPDLSCQNKFIPVDFSLQIIPSTFEYALAHIADNKLDLSGFDKWLSLLSMTQEVSGVCCRLAKSWLVKKTAHIIHVDYVLL